MIDLLRLLCGALIGLLRSSTRREAEILVLRHQLNVLKRQAPKPPLATEERTFGIGSSVPQADVLNSIKVLLGSDFTGRVAKAFSVRAP
jgi:hypothetical protein